MSIRDEFEKAVDQNSLKDVTWTGTEYKATPRSNSLTGAFQLMGYWEIWKKAWQAAREQGKCPVTPKDAPAYLWDEKERQGWAIGMNTQQQIADHQYEQGAEPVATVESIDQMNCSAVVRWSPAQNGAIPEELDRIGTKLYAQPQSVGVPEELRRALTAAVGVAHDRKGDVADEDGSYATTTVDNMIELETALCELFDTGSDDVIAHEMLPKMEALLTTTPQPEGDGRVRCHMETVAIALEALHFYADERFRGFGDDPETYEHYLAQQAISELQGLVPQPPQEAEGNE